MCIGIDSCHTPPKLVRAIEELCAKDGVKTVCDHPFSDTYVPLKFWGVDRRVMGAMIEIRLDLYMDDRTGKPHEGYQRMLISRMIERAAWLSPAL